MGQILYHPPVRWTEFEERHRRRQVAAVEAAGALERREHAPAAALLGGWRFAADPGLLAVLLEDFQGRGPALSDPGEVGPPSGDPDLAERHHRERLEPARASEDPAHALEGLAFLGERVERTERESWRARPYPVNPGRDAACAALWADWFSGNPWQVREGWERLFLPALTEVFGGVLQAHNVPPSVRAAALEEAREGFFFLMLGGGEAPAGWRELAVRTLEGAPEGPVDGLAAALRPGLADLLARCAVQRGHIQRTAARIWVERPEVQSRARALRGELAESPGRMEALLDLHVALRLLARWSSGPLEGAEADWRVVVQNRGRSRGRLRAVMALEPNALLEPLLGLDALAARTEAAVRRLAWAWARQQLGRGLTFDVTDGVTPPCHPPPEGLPPLSEGERAAAATWCLLVALKGRLWHLRAWVRTGSTGDTDSTWGRLLKDELPERLRDPGVGRNASYRRLRAALSEELEDMLQDLSPALTLAASLKGGKGLRGRFEASLTERWHPDVPFPRSGFPTFQRNASEALTALAAREE
jgi:hypothetical protein